MPKFSFQAKNQNQDKQIRYEELSRRQEHQSGVPAKYMIGFTLAPNAERGEVGD